MALRVAPSEHGTYHMEHCLMNIKRPLVNIERSLVNIERPLTNIEHSLANIECSLTNNECPLANTPFRMLQVLFWTENISSWIASFGVYTIEIVTFFYDCVWSHCACVSFRLLRQVPCNVNSHMTLPFLLLCAKLYYYWSTLLLLNPSLCVFMKQPRQLPALLLH